MRRAFSIVVCLVLNVGWLCPAYLCVNALIEWCQMELPHLLRGVSGPVNSFPYLSFSQQMLLAACVWGAVAITWNTLRRSAVRNEK